MNTNRTIIDRFSGPKTEQYAAELAKYRKYKEGQLQSSLSEFKDFKTRAELNRSSLLSSDFLIVANSEEDYTESIVENAIVKLDDSYCINLFCSFETLAKHMKKRKEIEFSKKGSGVIGIAIHKSKVHIISFEDVLKTLMTFEVSGGEHIEINIICNEGKVTIR